MRFSFRRIAAWKALAVALAAFAPVAAGAATDMARQPLDQRKIHALYNEGDFDGVLAALESYRQRYPAYPRSDSVFLAKHLAVVYSANPATREKGKYYMNQLLELLPSAKLVDMYVSDEIDRIFEKVREEFMTRQPAFGVDTSRIALPQRPQARSVGNETPARSAPKPAGPEPKPRAPEKSSSHALLWIGAGTAVATAAALTFYFTQDEKVEVKTLTVSDR